ncbi:hypothetical protein PsorP6_010050 [Peronosclerospora sorghi]|uniref:Uncharacterized protein n=1 Tax=Peronosclerospora sorghi TaxID=230839 RepID=A0ACC0VTF3_9STRA|nr:hypothetical protein PsorP6_010050 [Peronosclerospora sorghi]
MEYLRTNNLVQAQEFLKQASGLCPMDPLMYNELGSVFYKKKDFVPAIEMFSKALELCQTLSEASTLAALGFTYHMKGALEQAIEFYHSVSSCFLSRRGWIFFFFHALTLVDVHESLAYAPENTLARSMITVAFEELLSGEPCSFPEFADPPQKNAPKTSGLTPLTVRRPAGLRTTAPLSRRLDETYKSMETSAKSPSSSDLDLSQDSSMMNLDDD